MTENTNISPSKHFSKDVVEAINLLAQGKRNIMCGEMSHAVIQLQEACRILGKEYGELADECAEAYYWYGNALLEVSRRESGVLGDAIPEDSEANSQSSDDDDEDGADEDNEAVEKSSNVSGLDQLRIDNDEEEGSEASAEGDSVASEDIENEELDTTEAGKVEAVAPVNGRESPVPSTSKAGEPGSKPGTEGTNQDQESLDDVSNLQLAWEMLELAKLIYKRSDANDSKLKLADTHLKLGEIGLETEQYEQAITDLTECLNMQRQLLVSDDRRLAETYYQLGLACTFDKRYDLAITYYRNAIDVLEAKIAHLRKIVTGEVEPDPSMVDTGGFDTPAQLAEKEIDEISSILPDLISRIEDTEDERRNAAQVQWMMKESIATTSEPSSRFGSSSAGFSCEASTSASSFSQSTVGPAGGSSVSTVNNITHLVRKKRKSDVDELKSDDSKKQKVIDAVSSCSNGTGDSEQSSCNGKSTSDANVNDRQAEKSGSGDCLQDLLEKSPTKWRYKNCFIASISLPKESHAVSEFVERFKG